jgi:uncharacterized protein
MSVTADAQSHLFRPIRNRFNFKNFNYISPMNYRRLSIPALVKDFSSADRVVTGYFATFGNVDYDKDMFAPTAFDKTIREWGPEGRNKIVHLYQHNTTMPLAKPKVLRADEKGIYFESAFVDNSWGTDVLKLYEAGIINEHSVGFEIFRSDPERRDGMEFNLIKEVRMWEGSTVTFGANEDTPFTGFKGFDKAKANERIEKLSKAIRNGSFTDDTFHLLEIELAQLSTFVSNLPESSEPDAKSTRNDFAPALDEAITKFTINHLTQWK